MHNERSQQYYCRALLYQSTLCMLRVAYLIAIGYGVDEAVWINVDETPIPYHVGGRHGWKKHPVQELRDQMVEKASSHPNLVRHQWVGGFKNLQKVLGLATGRNRTLTSTQSCACNGLPPQSLRIDNICIGSAMEMESAAYP